MQTVLGGQIGLLVVYWACCSCVMQCHGFYPPLRRIFPVEGIFPLGVKMGPDSIPPNSFG